MAASFLDELTLLKADPDFVRHHPWIDTAHVLASSAVLERALPATRQLLDVEERNVTADFRAPFGPRYDLSFTIFGPEYLPHRARQRVVGFADLTSLIPEFSRPEILGVGSTAKRRLRNVLSERRFSRADHIVVEAPPVRDALQEHWGIPPSRVSVVSNTYDSVFEHPDRWIPLKIPRKPGVPNVCYVAKGYVHKNHVILGPLGQELARRGRPVQFVLTLSEEEWSRVSPEARGYSVNLGPRPREQLPKLYQGCDLSIFPSLLECFSATPVESLVMGTPLVASDRPFVHGICQDAAWYADPTDARSLADAVISALDESVAEEKVERGRIVAKELPSARERAAAYVELLSGLLG